MLKITAEEVNFVLYQYLHESGFQHSAFVFAQEANMHENKYNHYRVPAGLLITFLEKALTLINMETHLNDNEEMRVCQQPFTLLSPHYCDVNVTAKERMQSEIERLLEMDSQMTQKLDVRMTNSAPISGGDIAMRSNGIGANDQNQYDRQQEGPRRSSGINLETIESNQKSTLILNHHQGQVYHTSWNPCKRILVTGGQDKNAYLWSIQGDGLGNVELLQGLPHCKDTSAGFAGIETDITSIHWNPQGDKVVTSASDGYTRVWSDKGEIKSIFNCNNFGKAHALGFNKDNNAYNNAAPSDQFSSQQFKEDQLQMTTMVMVSKWNKDGSLIASGIQDKKVLVWMPQGPNQDHIVKTFNQDNDVVDLDWQNSTEFASCSLDQNIYLWSLSQEQQPLRVWRGHQGTMNYIKWDPAGTLLASCSDDDVAYLWSPKQNEPVKALRGHESSVNNLRWNNHPFQNQGNGNSPASLSANVPVPILATCGRDTTIKLWDVEYGKCIMTLTGHESSVLTIAFSADNKMLASGGLSDEVFIWSLQEQRIIKAYKMFPQMQGGLVTDTNWSHDSVMLAAGNNKSILLFDIRYLHPMQL